MTITGTDFSGVTKVAFGAVPATNFSVVSTTEITAVTPAQAAGTRPVLVTTHLRGNESAGGRPRLVQLRRRHAGGGIGLSPIRPGLVMRVAAGRELQRSHDVGKGFAAVGVFRWRGWEDALAQYMPVILVPEQRSTR